MTRKLLNRLAVGLALWSGIVLATAFAAKPEPEESAELQTFSVGRTTRQQIEIPRIEIERPSIDISRELTLQPVTPKASANAMDLPPLSLPSLGVQTSNSAPTAAPGQHESAGTASGVLERDVRPMKIEAPKYPREAALSGTAGHVVVAFTVSPEGKTTDISIVEASPRGVFERAARAAVARWEFEPAMAGGQAIPRRVQQRLNFDLN